MEIVNLAASITNFFCIPDTYAFVRRKFTKLQAAVLMYHRVCPNDNTWSYTGLSPKYFEKQMKYLRTNFEILSLETLGQYIQSGESLPKKSVVITFDDGYKDNFLYAYTILKKYNIPATVFLATGFIGTDKLLWWDKIGYVLENTSVKEFELDTIGHYKLNSLADRIIATNRITEQIKSIPDENKHHTEKELLKTLEVEIPPGLGNNLLLNWEEVAEMSTGGISFGAHTVNHPILTNLPIEQAKSEIMISKKDLEARLDRPVTTFSYPNGDRNAELVEFVSNSGFTCAVSTKPGRLINTKDNPYELNRMCSLDFNVLKIMLSGLWGDLHHLAIYRKN